MALYNMIIPSFPTLLRMPSKRKDVETEILKINQEIDKLKWALINEVLTQKKRRANIDKIKELKKVRKDLTKTIDAWRVKCVSSQKQ